MAILIIAQLTIREAQRRRILWVALIMGILFLSLYGLGMHYIFREFERNTFGGPQDFEQLYEIPANFLTMAGLYVTNFLVVIMSVLVSVATISSEVESRLIDTLITKPIFRWQLILGKWIGFAMMSIVYSLFLAGGILLIGYFRVGFKTVHTAEGMAILALNALVMMTITIAGGTQLSTLANGVLAFMLYGLAFVGGWVETVGAMFRNETAVNLGILASLLMPIEALWRKAALAFQPRLISDVEFAGPFMVSSQPSTAMVYYAIFYIIILILFALWSFGRRDL